jgi:hypothetical protein
MALLIAVGMGFAAFLAAHLALWRRQPSRDPRMGLLATLALAGLGIVAAAHRALAGRDVVGLCAALWIEIALFIGYFFLYAGVARSVSVTLLDCVRRAPSGLVPFEALLDAYQRSSRFADRITLMQRSGLVRVSGGAVSLTRRGAAFVRGVEALRRLAYAELQG